MIFEEEQGIMINIAPINDDFDKRRVTKDMDYQESLASFQNEVTDMAWNQNGWHVKPVYKYSTDGQLKSLTFEVEALVKHKSPPKGYPKEKTQYADPANYKYPIDSKQRVLAAWRYINQTKNQKGYTSSQVSAIKGRIKAAAKKYGLKLEEGK